MSILTIEKDGLSITVDTRKWKTPSDFAKSNNCLYRSVHTMRERGVVEFVKNDEIGLLLIREGSKISRPKGRPRNKILPRKRGTK